MEIVSVTLLSVTVWTQSTQPNSAKPAAAAKAAVNSSGASAPATAPSDATPGKGSVGALPTICRLEAVDSDFANVSLTPCTTTPSGSSLSCQGKALAIKAADPAIRTKLKQFHVGDIVRVDLSENGEARDVLGAFSTQEVCLTYRLLVLIVCALLIIAIATLITKGAPLKFIVGMDNRYSNSKFQVALWFWVLISTYLAAVVLRVWSAGWDFLGGVNIPQNLLVLSGLSAITYGGAKAITTSKVNAAANPAAAPGAVAAPVPNADPKNALVPGQERLFRDLVQNDVGGFDFGDFQMLLVTFVAVAMYVTLISHFLGTIQFLKTVSLPDVDTTILAAFGLGQGAYLAKKAGGEVGKS